MCINLEVSIRDRNKISQGLDVLDHVFYTKKSLQNNNIDVLTDPNATRDDMMKMIINRYGNKAISDYGWPQTEIYNKFTHEFPNLMPLNADPGFITHLPQFFEMCNKVDVNKVTCLEVREKLRKYLGKTTVYRGMKLTDEQVKEIKNSKTNEGIGIQPNFFRNVPDEHKGEVFDKLIMRKPFKDCVYKHCFTEESFEELPLNSVTRVKDIAIAVANTSPGQGDIYLYELKIDEIDIISFQDHGIECHKKAKGKLACIIYVDSNAVVYPINKDMYYIAENIVFGKISVNEIKSVEKVSFNSAGYKIINSLNELPEGFKVKNVTPEGYYELEIIK